MISFDKYYREYLGLTQGESEHEILPAERRAKPVAFFYQHHLISTVIDDRLVHSVSPKLAKKFRKLIGNDLCTSISTGLVRDIDNIMFEILPHLFYNPMRMHRMTLNSRDSLQEQDNLSVTAFTEDLKPLLLKHFSQRGMKFSEFYWNARITAIQEGRYFGIIKNDEIVATSFISDIDSGGGNIVVSTKPKYRNKGYGKAVVAKATKWCLENEIRPIYLVAIGNTPSVKLAEGLGFETMSEEIVVSSYIGIDV